MATGRKARVKILEKLGKLRKSVVLLYATSWRQNAAAVVANDVVEWFTHHLDAVGHKKRLSVVLATAGGDILAAWSLANLLRSYCDELEFLIPAKAMSAGTLLCLCAERIILTPQGVLGPIDPTVNNVLGPIANNQRVGVSVEDLNGYLDFLRKALGEHADISFALAELTKQVHPLVLGNAHRAREQIRMLGTKLLEPVEHDRKKVEEIMRFLCGEARSHDFTLNLREAKRLGLKVEPADPELYKVLRELWLNVRDEMAIDTPFTHHLVEAGTPLDYRFPRALIESVSGGGHAFISAGTLNKTQAGAVVQFNDDRKQEGWIYENPLA